MPEYQIPRDFRRKFQEINSQNFEQIDFREAYLYRVTTNGKLEKVTNMVAQLIFKMLNIISFRTSKTVVTQWKREVSFFKEAIETEIDRIEIADYASYKELQELKENIQRVQSIIQTFNERIREIDQHFNDDIFSTLMVSIDQKIDQKLEEGLDRVLEDPKFGSKSISEKLKDLSLQEKWLGSYQKRINERLEKETPADRSALLESRLQGQADDLWGVRSYLNPRLKIEDGTTRTIVLPHGGSHQEASQVEQSIAENVTKAFTDEAKARKWNEVVKMLFTSEDRLELYPSMNAEIVRGINEDLQKRNRRLESKGSQRTVYLAPQGDETKVKVVNVERFALCNAQGRSLSGNPDEDIYVTTSFEIRLNDEGEFVIENYFQTAVEDFSELRENCEKAMSFNVLAVEAEEGKAIQEKQLDRYKELISLRKAIVADFKRIKMLNADRKETVLVQEDETYLKTKREEVLKAIDEELDQALESLKDYITEEVYLKKVQYYRSMVLSENPEGEKEFLMEEIIEDIKAKGKDGILPQLKRDIDRQYPIVLNGERVSGYVHQTPEGKEVLRARLAETYEAIKEQVELAEVDPKKREFWIDTIQAFATQRLAALIADFTTAAAMDFIAEGLAIAYEQGEIAFPFIHIIRNENGSIEKILFENVSERIFARAAQNERGETELIETDKKVVVSIYCEVTREETEDGQVRLKIEDLDIRFTGQMDSPVTTKEKHPELF